MSIYGLSKKAFRGLFPIQLRQKLWHGQNHFVNGLFKFKDMLANAATNDEVYDCVYGKEWCDYCR